MKNIFVILFMLFMIASFPARAQKSDAPVEISAAHSLEWDRNAKTYTARDDARAKQGDFDLASGTITAHYRDDLGSTDIWQMVAEKNVVLSSPPYKAYGNKAVYDVVKNNATLTGGDLKITTDTATLTAQDKIEFFGEDNRLIATGNAVALRAADKLQASVITGYFKKDAQGKLSIDRMTADGNVVITTPKETVHGDHGIYDIATEKAVLTGAVKIYQGENWLEGTRAEVDLETGLSKLFAPENAATEGRVKGTFYPKKSN